MCDDEVMMDIFVHVRVYVCLEYEIVYIHVVLFVGWVLVIDGAFILHTTLHIHI
jgi:hypothetical protein